MKRILLAMICAILVAAPVLAAEKTELSESKKKSIVENCVEIRENLREVQRADAKTRVYLGKYYEMILNNFVMPLNVRLVENSMADADLVENQNDLTDAKSLFGYDFVIYQKGLEELIATDCKSEPEVFYKRLVVVRQKRKVMEQDTLKMRNLMSAHLKLANGLKEKL